MSESSDHRFYVLLIAFGVKTQNIELLRVKYRPYLQNLLRD